MRTGKPSTRLAVGVPRVDVLARGDDDLLVAVAVDVADNRRAQRLARRVELGGQTAGGGERDGLGAHRLAAVEALERLASESSA